MRSFSEVIREETDNKKPYRLVVIAERRMVKKTKKNSNKPVVKKPSSTSSKLYNLAKEGCEVYSVKVNGAYIERADDGVITIHNQDDEKGFYLDGDTLIMVRGAVTTKDSYLDLISQIERYGFPVVNRENVLKFVQTNSELI